MKKKCVQCGETFEISDAVKELYREKGLELPQCCPLCRKSNRIRSHNVAIVRGREKRKQRSRVLRAVPSTVMLLLIVLSFALIHMTRGGADGEPSADPSAPVTEAPPASVQRAILFRSEEQLEEHYETYGREMGYDSAEEYLAGANAVIHNSTALCKTEKKHGDAIYYVESTNDFVAVSQDGYLRTYIRPEEGIAFFNGQ